MKKVLFATTAIVALGLMPLAAQAQDKKPAEKPISLSLGGYFRIHAMAGWQDDGKKVGGNTIRDHGIGRESEIWFRGETQLDNGLRVGVQVELEGETSADQIDNTYMYFQHANYGRFLWGEDFGSSVKTHKGVVGHITGMGAISHFAAQGSWSGRNNYTAGPSLNTFMILDSVNDKAIYDTPRIFGFRLSGTYTPDAKDAGGNCNGTAGTQCGETGNGLNPKQNGAASVSQVWTVSFDYVETFGPVGVGFGAGYQRGYRERTANGSNGEDDPDSFNLGAEVSFAGFRVGAAYKKINDNFAAIGNPASRGANELTPAGNGVAIGDRHDFTVGADYTFGRWVLGATYGFVKQEGIPLNARKTSTDEMDQWTLAVNYILGPGITLYGGYMGFDMDGKCGGGATRCSEAQNSGSVFILGTQLNF